MALQVWLPLNGTLENKGLSNVTVTNNGATVNNNGKIGKCYSFNGSANKKITATISPTITSSVGSIACWVRFNSFPGSSSFYELVHIGTSGGYAACLFGIYMEYTNHINISINGSSTGTNYYTHSLSTNIWYHLCATLDGTTVKLYINGSEVLSKTATKASYNTAASTVYIGGTTSYWLNGCINDVRIYDHCLSPKEVKEISKGLILHYKLDGNDIGVTIPRNGPIFYDSSGYCNHGSITGTLTTSNDSPRYTQCLKNTNKYPCKSNAIHFPSSSGLTMACWMKLVAYGKQTSGLWATSNNSSTPDDYNETTCNHRDSYFDMRGTNRTTYRLYCGSDNVPLNTWKHVVVTHDGTNAKLYIDGALVSTLSVPTPLVGFNYLYVGYSCAGGLARQCLGSWSDFRIYCTALSADDIKELYNTSAFVTNNGVFAEYELYEDNLSDVKKTGLLETANFYENGAESGYALDTDKTRVASNYIISEEFIEI